MLVASFWLVVPLVAACPPAARPQAPWRATRVTTVGASSLEAITEYSGEAQAHIESRLHLQVGGKITRWQAKIRQCVSSGHVLTQLGAAQCRLGATAAHARVTVALANRDLVAADFKR